MVFDVQIPPAQSQGEMCVKYTLIIVFAFINLKAVIAYFQTGFRLYILIDLIGSYMHLILFNLHSSAL